jgi:hypothetical protein
VDLSDRYGNRRQRVERLISKWNQGSSEGAAPDGEPDNPLTGSSAEPRRRPRTRLTDEEVDTMRTARANGVSVTALARRHGIHRGTVWAKTKDVIHDQSTGGIPTGQEPGLPTEKPS